MSILDALSFGYGVFKDWQGRKDAKKAQAHADARDDSKIQRHVVDSRAAGIHPLASLGSQIAGASGSSGMVYSGDAAGDALRTAQSRASVSPLQRENMELQNEALRADIGRTRADTARIVADATSRSGIARAVQGNRGVSTQELAGHIGADPRMPDAQDYEQRYGELSDFLFGPQILIRDIYADMKKNPSRYYTDRTAKEAQARNARARRGVEGSWHGAP